MKLFFNYLVIVFLFIAIGLSHNADGHSVQVGYCVSCSGELTLYAEHWHSNEDPSTTTMTLQLNINGVISTVTGSPTANLQNIPLADLPGCSDPIHIFASCPSEANTYNDWVVYHFPALPTGVPIIITVLSGNSAFTEDACGMYPASTPVIVVPTIVNPPPVADSSQSTCTGNSVTLNLISFSGVFQWQSAPAPTGPWTDIPGATTTPFNTGPLTANTSYRATEVGTCESNSVTITVRPDPVPTSGTGAGNHAGAPIIACPTNVPGNTGTPSTTGYTYSWLPASGLSSTTISNPTVSLITPNTTTTYTLTTTTSYGCTSNDSVKVTTIQLPTATIAGTTQVCKNSTAPNITFTGAATTAPYTFTYAINGVTQPTVTTISGNNITVSAPTTTAGTFMYSLMSVKDAGSTSCSQLQSGNATVTVNPLPTAAITGTTAVCKNDAAPNITFTGAGGTAPYTFTYTINSGTNQTVTTTSGNSVNLSVPTTLASAYTFALISIQDASSTACIQSQNGSVTVIVNPLPTATITGTTAVCKNAVAPNITFTGASATAPYTFTYAINGVIQPTITSLGNSATVSVPTSVAGTFIYSLVSVKDASSTTCSQAQIGGATVTVNPLPTATIAGTTAVCRNSASPNITFTGGVGTAPYTFTYKINSGANQTVTTTSGNSVTVPAPTNTVGTFIYDLVSIQDASITACSQVQSGSATVTINPLPVANFSFTNICLTQAMSFNDSSTVSSGINVDWSWNFGDNSPLDSTQNPVYLYSNTGIYNVTLITTTNNGCKSTISKSVVVHPNPNTGFSTANTCDGFPAGYFDQSTITATDTLHSWTWNFGDNSPLNTNQSVSGGHLYATPGTYQVQLLTTSNFGCSDSITKTVVVNPNPDVNFAASDTAGCELLCMNFQDESSIITGINVHWTWNVGDGGPAVNSQNFDHCYNNDSVFSPLSIKVTLTVTSDSGCISILSKNNYITVYPNPNAAFTAQPETVTIMDPIVSIIDASSGADFWNWEFGDLETSSGKSPLPHTYPDTGSYTIMLITSTQYGCVDTAYQSIFVGPDVAFYIPNAFSPNNDDINDTFSPKGIFVSEYEMTIFDRWGNSVFFSDDFNNPWDGKANYEAEIAQSDVYIYVIKATDIRRKTHNYKGIVTLVR